MVSPIDRLARAFGDALDEADSAHVETKFLATKLAEAKKRLEAANHAVVATRAALLTAASGRTPQQLDSRWESGLT